jgi:hypothetical protein
VSDYYARGMEMMSSFKRTRQNMDAEMEKQRADRAARR